MSIPLCELALDPTLYQRNDQHRQRTGSDTKGCTSEQRDEMVLWLKQLGARLRFGLPSALERVATTCYTHFSR